jgi:hypothetical protein
MLTLPTENFPTPNKRIDTAAALDTTHDLLTALASLPKPSNPRDPDNILLDAADDLLDAIDENHITIEKAHNRYPDRRRAPGARSHRKQPDDHP